jgi:MFS family permease
MTAEPLQEIGLSRRAGAMTFGAIFAIESLVRSLNSTVISLQAFDLLKSSQAVSVLSACVSIAVLATTLALPYVLGRMRRRWGYSLGIGLMMAASLCLASYTVVGQSIGMYLRNCGAAVMHITLSLYILDHIRRADLTRTEPIRLSISTISWMAGPVAGVWFYTQYGAWGPQLVSIAVSLFLLAVFWWLRLSDANTLPSGTLEPFNPLANVGRFIAQPRLRLAWLIAFGRSCFWATLFIYAPLLLVESGEKPQFAGLVISLSQATLFAAYGFGRLAMRSGVRRVIVGCLVVSAVASVAAGLAGTAYPIAAAILLLAGSVAASGLDGVGGIPFLRAVKARDRQRMTAVYRTFIDLSELIPGFVFAIALIFFDTGSVFVILGFGLFAIAAISWRYLPRTM